MGKYEISYENNFPVIKVYWSDNVIIGKARFQTAAENLIETGIKKLAIDFSDFDFLSSNEINSIIQIREKLSKKHGALWIIVNTGDSEKVVEAIGLPHLLKVVNNRKELAAEWEKS